jgi:hypothetical protein
MKFPLPIPETTCLTEPSLGESSLACQGKKLKKLKIFPDPRKTLWLAIENLKSRIQNETAEGVRFELTRPFGLPVFKTGAINHSATPPGYPAARIVPLLSS